MKDPGVKLFRRLKEEWSSLVINNSELKIFDTSNLPQWMKEEAKEVLEWGLGHLKVGTFPRADYHEMLELAVVCLGGPREGFRFRLPGADHLA